MKISKLTNNYILQHIKDLFINNKNCCGEFSFKLICCGVNKYKWTFFNNKVNLTYQLKNKHIAGLNYLLHEHSEKSLLNKEIVLICCDISKYFVFRN